MIDKLCDTDISEIDGIVTLIASISQYDKYFDESFEKILNLFYQNPEFLEKKSEILINKICMKLSPE